MSLTRPLLVLLMLLMMLPAASEEQAWQIEKEQDGIRISSRAVDGWTIREIRGEARYTGRLSSLVAAINDPAASPELNEFVVESIVQNRERDTRYQLYTLTKMPWPLADRDVLMQREIAQDPTTLAVIVTDTAVTGGVPEKKDLVRITRSRQQWTLTPAADGSVAIELRMLTDPNGPVPASLLNKLSISTPFKTLVKLKELGQNPRYALAQLPFVKGQAASR